MEIEELDPFGGAIRGLDITAPDETLPVRLIQLVAKHRVLVLRGQRAGDQHFAAFLQSLGSLTFTDGETPVDGALLLNSVTNVGRTCPPRSVFHTDTSYIESPPALTALRAVEVPQSGGETEFTDQVHALNTLSGDLRAAIRGRRIRHTFQVGPDDERSYDHPAVLRHPVSGENALYLSTPERCKAVSGLSKDDSRVLIERLYAHSISSACILRHRWQSGDIVLWDNRLTMHRANHSAVQGNRTLHRGLVGTLHETSALI